MALRDLTRDAVIAAIREFDRVGRERFLVKYGFAESRRLFVVYEGKFYDSKALAGAAHAFLSGQPPLRATEFSGGWSHAAGVLQRLGFDVIDRVPLLTVQELVRAIEELRPATVASGPMLKQAVVLLWAIGRAQRGADRVLVWERTQAELIPLLSAHHRSGERPEGRPDYPIAALCRAGLWTLDTSAAVPTAHGDARLRRWFDEHQPDGGLPAPVYELLRSSGLARVQVVTAIIDKFFGDFDYVAVTKAVGLEGGSVIDDNPALTDDEASSEDPKRAYQDLIDVVTNREASTRGKRRPTVGNDPIRLAAAQRAVILRSGGLCENPSCGKPAPDHTDSGLPVLEVDHVSDIATGGRDHPVQMIALCPDCHAVKTRGRSRHQLRERLLVAAKERHEAWCGTAELLEA
ncbi:5-methylcytosine-specific restriction protein A [Nocardia tenerifensis]|uniref:5-methylcytosine-specific restriction protein A n=1 Tax=Nocardia tenerifensis TaxID=228006 RepID=A0A318KAL7_9NOCA|nr:HNH endonuclease signature motif containing protein [Nocardia tenerifensis]PXX68772.1 5-methylcytosine-specific restriction protein A [Nocardia tenerifensis]